MFTVTYVYSGWQIRRMFDVLTQGEHPFSVWDVRVYPVRQA